MVDSLELMSNVVSRNASKETSMRDVTHHDSKESVKNVIDVDEIKQIPSYMKMEQHPHCQLYSKMTAEDWDAIKKFKEMCDEKSQRRSSVTFDQDPGPHKESRRNSSILKRSSIDIKTEIDSEQDAMFLVHEKCLEALSKLNMEEVFKMLCDESNEEC